MGQILVGFALGWLAFTKEGKDMASKISTYLADTKHEMKKDEGDAQTPTPPSES